MSKNSILGLSEIVVNLGKVPASVGVRVEAGLKSAGLLLQKESQKLAPVEFGNLKASAYTVAKGSGLNTVVEVGYRAAYAAYVHELVAMKLKGQLRKPSPPHKGRYWDPQGQARAKFLEEPARRLSTQIVAAIRQIAKMP